MPTPFHPPTPYVPAPSWPVPPDSRAAPPIPAGSTPTSAKAFISSFDSNLLWEAPAADKFGPTTGVYWRAVYSPGTFDVMPDLVAASGVDPQAIPINRSSAPAVDLLFAGLSAIGVTEIAVATFYEASAINPKALRGLGFPQDVTLDFFDGATLGSGAVADSVLFTMPAPGSPIRYWRPYIIFDVLDDILQSACPAIRVQTQAI